MIPLGPLMKAGAWLSGIDIGSVTKSIAAGYEAKQRAGVDTHRIDAETARAITIEQMKADVRSDELREQLALADRSDWMTRWIRPTGAAIALFYFGALVVNAVFHLELAVEPLPYPFNYLVPGIIGVFFLLRPTEKRGRADVVTKLK